MLICITFRSKGAGLQINTFFVLFGDVVMNRPDLSATYAYRDFKSLNVNSLYSAMGSINWNKGWFFSTIDNKLNFLNRNLSPLFNMHVPLRSVNVLNSSCPWYNSKVRAAIRKRNKYYATWRKNLTDTSWRRYKAIRNKTTAIIRQAKRWYSYTKLDPSLPIRELWRNLKKFKIHCQESPECDIDLDELNDYFISVGTKTNCSPILKESSSCATLEEQFQFLTVSELDVLKALSKIKSNAVGDDNISLKLVRIVMQYIIGPLTHIINHCLTSSCFPAVWKKAIVFPVANKTNAIYAGDYRPISILSTFSKFCENLMATHHSFHVSFVQNNCLLSPLQSGFKQSQSCSTVMVKILDDIRISFDNGDLTLLCLLDFSKAFDSVDHKLLCLKLKY
ncbi:uncharacterized protein LOC129250851 [Anastrepha obliqua]|uniref:uncharacterized protein LOC129250851 n=1 Tax=Anastrepha obliqua TaxID=95512 RepID=UPI00240A8123|nr:uncharacterized protein LOC129250851 [Anastrepha obliqua]